jgi:hypothetical protein
MSSAATIWTSGDMSEQIGDYNGEFILITTATKNMKKVSLGNTLEEAQKKLIELGRYDIAKQLR